MRLVKRRWTRIGVILSLYLGLVGTVSWQLDEINNNILTKQAINSASGYATLLTNFRSLYTSEVIANLPKGIITVSHDYHQKKNAIPLPATLTLKLAEKTQKEQQKFEVGLFSQYPFPWRANRKLDTHTQRALQQIAENPNSTYTAIDKYKGREYFHYAKADFMSQACVDCHNSHPDSPKIDWKKGDARGILVVKIPVAEISDATTSSLHDILFLIILIGLIATAVNIFFILEIDKSDLN